MNITDHAAARDDQFRKDIVALAPHLRTFALSLCRDRVRADDLVQDTMLRAWEFRSQYQSGTLLRAWMFTILRNKFLGDQRRKWRVCELDSTVAENTLEAVSDPNSILALDELRRALTQLSTDQRKAVMLIGAGGYAYGEAATICGASVGTIKSRTSRGRTRLHKILETGAYTADGLPSGAAMSTILDQVDQISRGAACYA